MRLGPAGLECYCLAIERGGLGRLALRSQRLTEIVVGLGEIRLKRNRLLKMTDCLVGAAEVKKDVAEIVMRFGIVGPETERTPKFTLCLVELALLPKRIAEIVVGFGMVWIEFMARR